MGVSTSTTTTTSTTLEPTTTEEAGTGTTETTGEFEFPPAQEVPSTTSPPDEGGGGAAGPSTLLPYYVLAFLVGFREGTFRNLIKRAADVLLGPGDPGAPPAGITVQPAPVHFGKGPAGGRKSETVTVTNSGTGDLRVYPSRATARGTDLADEHGVFSLAANAVEGATIAPGANASLRVEFRPEAAGEYTATLTISSNAGRNPIELRGEATEPEAPERERPRPAPPRKAAGRRRLLDRGRRRGGRGSSSTG